tara:strand:+ start:1378 stop:1533 length:156 start_codon:yes stop_codon:yes gene_type:complete
MFCGDALTGKLEMGLVGRVVLGNFKKVRFIEKVPVGLLGGGLGVKAIKPLF